MSIMGKYAKGDHVKVEVESSRCGGTEWLWVLVEESDDSRQLVFGQLDNDPVANSDLRLGQKIAVRYDKIRDHKRFP